MNLPYGLLSDSWLWLAIICCFLYLIVILRTAPWKALLNNTTGHAFFASCVLLLLLWHITTVNFPGLNYHYLGAMLLTLMFRWQLAFIAMNLVMLGMTFNGQFDWQTLPINALTMAIVPISIAWIIHRLVQRYLPNHFFIYIFVTAFFGAALTILISLLLTSGLLLVDGVYSFTKLQTDFYPVLPLMMFPEAFITGMLITLLVVFLPESVMTFDDRRYIDGK